jgi:translation initiation factor IF-1
MARDELLELSGVVSEALPNAMYRVKLDNRREIVAVLAESVHGPARLPTVGDKVLVEVKPYDLTRGRISFCIP